MITSHQAQSGPTHSAETQFHQSITTLSTQNKIYALCQLTGDHRFTPKSKSYDNFMAKFEAFKKYTSSLASEDNIDYKNLETISNKLAIFHVAESLPDDLKKEYYEASYKGNQEEVSRWATEKLNTFPSHWLHKAKGFLAPDKKTTPKGEVRETEMKPLEVRSNEKIQLEIEPEITTSSPVTISSPVQPVSNQELSQEEIGKLYALIPNPETAWNGKTTRALVVEKDPSQRGLSNIDLTFNPARLPQHSANPLHLFGYLSRGYVADNSNKDNRAYMRKHATEKDPWLQNEAHRKQLEKIAELQNPEQVTDSASEDTFFSYDSADNKYKMAERERIKTEVLKICAAESKMEISDEPTPYRICVEFAPDRDVGVSLDKYYFEITLPSSAGNPPRKIICETEYDIQNICLSTQPINSTVDYPIEFETGRPLQNKGHRRITGVYVKNLCPEHYAILHKALEQGKSAAI
jgi:hypothetical protein